MITFKQIRRLTYLVILLGFAIFQLATSGLVRRTFEFYAYDDQRSVIEERMLHKTPLPEASIRAYIEELVLGPVSVDLAPLVTAGTRLRAFMYRDGVVYADFTPDAIHPVQGGRPLFDGFLAINQGIRRNFRQVSDVKLFVFGNEVFFEEFEKFFGAE